MRNTDLARQYREAIAIRGRSLMAGAPLRNPQWGNEAFALYVIGGRIVVFNTFFFFCECGLFGALLPPS